MMRDSRQTANWRVTIWRMMTYRMSPVLIHPPDSAMGCTTQRGAVVIASVDCKTTSRQSDSLRLTSARLIPSDCDNTEAETA